MNRRKGLYERFVKRLIDVVCSGLALIALSPLLLITAVLVRIKLGTPVIFMQERPGKNEQIFKLYKFRSMRDATGKDGRPLPDDERLTSFGRKLRSTSIDELPELWNIFRGDMSIVGPRPLLVEYLPYYTKEEKHRHDVKPGLTGLAQVNGRNTLTWEEKFDYDLRYIQNITFGQDAAIVFHTVEKVFKRADILIGKQFKVGKLTEERKNWVLTPEGAGKPEDAVCEEKRNMIVGSYVDVTLREFEKKDIPQKVEWINNAENNRFLHYALPLREDKTLEWFLHKDNTKRLDCIIEYNEKPVGLIGLLQIDRMRNQAEYYITIGETDYKGKGIASKASKALLHYAFTELNLEKVYLTVDPGNDVAIKLYTKLGFKRGGSDETYGQGESLYFEMENKTSALFPVMQNTAVQELKNCIPKNSVYIKRDDLIPVSFGGNKARKALNFFMEIDKGGYDHVVTYGSSSSNHCRIISNMAAARGLPCTIIGPEESSEPTFNSKMMELFGAEIIVVPVSEVHDAIEAKLAQLKSSGKKPYFIQGGGHGNLGTQAYVDCYEEIRSYEQKNSIHFDYIFFASGTGTTQAGLVCGQLIHGDDCTIVGISIARKNPRGRNIVLDSIREYMNENKIAVSEKEIERNTIFLDDFTGAGYGRENPEISKTIREMLINYGIPLDLTYTGKAFTGMKQYLLQEKISGKNILFIHTGGTPLFFDYLKGM